jgi:hypothetical protein
MRAPILTRAPNPRLLLVCAATAMLLAGCVGASAGSPGPTIATTPSLTATPTVPTPSMAASTIPSSTTGGGVPPLLATIPGFDVSQIEQASIDLFTAAAGASLGTSGSLGDTVGARATRTGDAPVDLIAFTVVPASGVSENDALFLVMEGMAQGGGGDWVADESIGWFALDHDTGRALMIPWGNVPGGTVFLFVVGPGDAPVEDVANAILEAG